MTSIVFSLIFAAGGDVSTEARQAALNELRRILPASEAWDAWLEKSGELPPDFDALPSRALLPDPLVRIDGTRVATPAEWQERREELKESLHHWILGSVPPPPDHVEARVLEERQEEGASVRHVELRFGPEGKARIRLELLIPPGPGPFPVFMTQHSHRGWALIALRRGYIACVYAGADSQDDTDSFLETYPEADWSRLMRRAWAAGRCIDYLETLPEARTDQIALTGHSRNGKQSLMAAAIEPRIAVVISSSSGAGGSLSARYYGETQFGEGIENITRVFPEWFHPRWRFFAGREHKLPADLPDLVAMSAPRPCLLSIALNDGVESAWAMEETYRTVKPVWALHGAEDKLRILWRPGGHETWPTVIERYLDWCDLQFGRGEYGFPERLIHPWDWDAWAALPGNALDVTQFPERPFSAEGVQTGGDFAAWREGLRAAVHDMLGTPPPQAMAYAETYGEEPDHIEELLGRRDPGSGLEKHDVMFGEYLNGDVYMPEGAQQSGKKLPAILWLHPVSNPRGYVAAYRRGEQIFRTFARAGYAVFCYDQIGHGRRLEEVEGFYGRYPNWSLLGKMVRDAQAALDVMGELPYLDAGRIVLLGYDMGAMVALHVAALDDRPAGVALVSAPAPFRLDTDINETGGVVRWSKSGMLLPRLGYFAGQESRTPYDVDELLAAIAPRPVLVVSPRLDRFAPPALVAQGIESAARVYAKQGIRERLVQVVPDAYSHFDETMQKNVLAQFPAVFGPIE